MQHVGLVAPWRGILVPRPGSNLHTLDCKADSYPLDHQRSLEYMFLNMWVLAICLDMLGENSCIETLPTLLQTVTAFGDRTLKKGD